MSRRWPDTWPWFSVSLKTAWYGWLPRVEHERARYFHARSRLDAGLAEEGTRMSQPATRFHWGPVTATVVWP